MTVTVEDKYLQVYTPSNVTLSFQSRLCNYSYAKRIPYNMEVRGLSMPPRIVFNVAVWVHGCFLFTVANGSATILTGAILRLGIRRYLRKMGCSRHTKQQYDKCTSC